jgi:hypothetical protein
MVNKMITTKQILDKIDEVFSIWDVCLQIKDGNPMGPKVKSMFAGNYVECSNYLKNESNLPDNSGGILMCRGRQGGKSIFFRVNNGKVETAMSPFQGLKFLEDKDIIQFNLES